MIIECKTCSKKFVVNDADIPDQGRVVQCGNCSVTYQLNKYNLRNNSFPFDWSKIKLNKLQKVLENNFLDYSEIKLLRYSKNHNSFIIKNKYSIFAHEYLNNYNLEEFKIKLKKRIYNFKLIKNPVFIRIEIYSYKNKILYNNYWFNIIKILRK